MKNKLSCLLIAFILNISLSTAQSEICFPISFRGATPGLLANDDVEKLFGKGYFDENSGHTGSFNYLNENKSLALSIELGMNAYIETVVIQNAINLPVSEISKYPISKTISPVTHFDILNLIGLNSESIKQKYGTPTFVNNEKDPENKVDYIWGYVAESNSKSCNIYSAIYFWFKNNQVETLIISNNQE